MPSPEESIQFEKSEACLVPPLLLMTCEITDNVPAGGTSWAETEPNEVEAKEMTIIVIAATTSVLEKLYVRLTGLTIWLS